METNNEGIPLHYVEEEDELNRPDVSLHLINASFTIKTPLTTTQIIPRVRNQIAS